MSIVALGQPFHQPRSNFLVWAIIMYGPTETILPGCVGGTQGLPNMSSTKLRLGHAATKPVNRQKLRYLSNLYLLLIVMFGTIQHGIWRSYTPMP